MAFSLAERAPPTGRYHGQVLMGCPALVSATQSSRSTMPTASASTARITSRPLGQCSGYVCRARMDPNAQTDLARRCNSTLKEAFVWFHPLSFRHRMLGSFGDLSPVEKALSAIASDNKLFLEHSSPIAALNEIAQLLVLTQEAIQTLSQCRSQYSDSWLAVQSQNFGLDVDETFVANYEHLLLRLQQELDQALARESLEALLYGDYDKKQRQMLDWITQSFEKPRPLGTSTSFPWTIKPSLAVLWGVSSSYGMLVSENTC